MTILYNKNNTIVSNNDRKVMVECIGVETNNMVCIKHRKEGTWYAKSVGKREHGMQKTPKRGPWSKHGD